MPSSELLTYEFFIYKHPLTLEDRKNKRKIFRAEALRQLAQTNQLSAKAQRELDRAAHRVKLGQPDKTKLGRSRSNRDDLESHYMLGGFMVQ